MPAPLTFHILGPLRVTHAAAPVALGGPRERVLLAALLVEHGQVVSGDRLAQALWSDRPPATARHQVAIGVSRLRKALAAAGAAGQEEQDAARRAGAVPGRDLEPQRARNVPAVIQRHGQHRTGEPGRTRARMRIRQHRPRVGAGRRLGAG